MKKFLFLVLLAFAPLHTAGASEATPAGAGVDKKVAAFSAVVGVAAFAWIACTPLGPVGAAVIAAKYVSAVAVGGIGGVVTYGVITKKEKSGKYDDREELHLGSDD